MNYYAIIKSSIFHGTNKNQKYNLKKKKPKRCTKSDILHDHNYIKNYSQISINVSNILNNNTAFIKMV